MAVVLEEMDVAWGFTPIVKCSLPADNALGRIPPASGNQKVPGNGSRSATLVPVGRRQAEYLESKKPRSWDIRIIAKLLSGKLGAVELWSFKLGQVGGSCRIVQI